MTKITLGTAGTLGIFQDDGTTQIALFDEATKEVELASRPFDIAEYLAADHTAVGEIITATVDTNAVGFGAALVMAADGHFDEADADAIATMPCIALALETGTGSKKVLLRGIIRDDTWNWTPGARLYVSTTQGTLTATAPAGEDDCVQCVGSAWDDDHVLFNPSMDVAVVTV